MSFMLVLQVLRKRFWIVGVTFLSTLVGAILVLIFVPARYDGIATASIDPSIVDPVSGAMASINSAMIVQGNLVALAKSNQVALAVVHRLNMDADAAAQSTYASSSDSGIVDIRQWLDNQLLDHVDAKFAPQSNVISITYKAPSPQQAAVLANAFMSSFIDAAIAVKGSSAQKAAAWFAPQIEKYRNDLAQARERLTHFQSETKLLAPSASDAENDQLLAVTSDLTKAKADLVSLQTQLRSPAPTAATSNDAQSVDIQTLVSLRANLSNVDADIAKTQTETGANNPRLLEKFATRQSLQRQIEAQIQDYRKKLSDRIATQTERVATLQQVYSERLSGMIGIQGQREQLLALSHDVQFQQEELERVRKAASQARLQSQLSFSNIALIDTATPPTSVSFPKPIIVGALAVGLGFGLGVLFALIAEALDRRLRTADDLQFITDAPLLGVMIDIRPKKPARIRRLIARMRLATLFRHPPPKTDDALARL